MANLPYGQDAHFMFCVYEVTAPPGQFVKAVIKELDYTAPDPISCDYFGITSMNHQDHYMLVTSHILRYAQAETIQTPDIVSNIYKPFWTCHKHPYYPHPPFHSATRTIMLVFYSYPAFFERDPHVEVEPLKSLQQMLRVSH